MAISMGAALLGSAIIGGGASILGGNAQKKAANKAADVSYQNNQANIAAAAENRDYLNTKIDPYNQVGLGANAGLADMMKQGVYSPSLSSEYTATMNPGSFDDWKANTGYDFNLERGLKGIGIGAGADGWLQSGAAIKGALDHMTGLSGREYGNYRSALGQYGTYADQFANQERGYQTDQQNNQWNRLASQQGVGQTAVGQLAGVGNNYTSQVIGSNNTNAAAQANAALAKGNANANMYAGVGNAAGYGLGAMMGGGGGIYGMYPSGGAIGV